MKEIGGYIEFEHYKGKMLHESAIMLNCGRNALAYVIEANNIKKILMPKFMCSSCNKVLLDYNINVRYYKININFRPDDISLQEDEWLYIVNFYGQLTNPYIASLQKRYYKIIVDNAQAYFQPPIDNVATIYTCRKFFGVSDGAMLYSNILLKRNLDKDISYDRMHFLLGRYEKPASDFYVEYVHNNLLLVNEPIKKMSLLTQNLLHAIDYEGVSSIREENFSFLNEKFCGMNQLKLDIPIGAYMYPLYVKGGDYVRKKLLEKKIYIPILWSDVFKVCSEDEIEYDLALNILPLPIDQRYGRNDMEYLVNTIREII